MLPWIPGYSRPQALQFRSQANTPQMRPQETGMLPPAPGIPPAMGSMFGKLGGMAAQGYLNRDMPQWAPTNDAAGAMNDGAYGDPLMRQAASWNAPNLGFSGWLDRMFK